MQAAWDALDPYAPPSVTWIRRPSSGRLHLLLGAFDPPTNAHVALARSAPGGTFVLTRVLLDRSATPLLTPPRRLELLDAIAAEEGLGVALCNRGTYVEVDAAFRSSGIDPVFIVGSDKLPQLADPRFYPDGVQGVVRTFERVRFAVAARGSDTPVGVEMLPPLRPDVATISATDVRRRVAAGELVDGLVPQVVAAALRDYTQGSEEQPHG